MVATLYRKLRTSDTITAGGEYGSGIIHQFEREFLVPHFVVHFCLNFPLLRVLNYISS